MRTLRRELAGPTLVAVPCSADSAKRIAPGTAFASALVREAGGAFGLWAPNPAWSAAEEQPPGQLTLLCEAHGASIGLTRIDHFEPGTALDTAVESVQSWFRLLHPDLRLGRRETVVVRDRSAIRLCASGGPKGAVVQATVDVIPHRGQFLVLVCRAPASAWQELAADFAFLLRSVELDPQGVVPVLQGPLAGRESPPKAAGKVRPAAPRAVSPSRPKKPAPTVRIPNDG